jgi:histidinol-phosphate aminotransferase
VAYQICAQAARVETEFVPVKKDFTVDLEKMADLIEKDVEHRIRIAFIPNPNNPTGTYSTQNQIEKFLERVGQREDLLIVFDEAYTEFVRATDYKPAVAFCEKYPTVVVMRTMSKVYGLAGLRLGVLIADPSVVDLYNRIRNPFNTNELAQVATVAALDDVDFIKASQKLVWEGLDYFYNSFNEMGLPFIPSQGNFVLVEMPKPAAEIYNALLRKGIILRPVGNYGLPNHLRITVGLPQENEAAIKALKECLN